MLNEIWTLLVQGSNIISLIELGLFLLGIFKRWGWCLVGAASLATLMVFIDLYQRVNIIYAVAWVAVILINLYYVRQFAKEKE